MARTCHFYAHTVQTNWPAMVTLNIYNILDPRSVLSTDNSNEVRLLHSLSMLTKRETGSIILCSSRQKSDSDSVNLLVRKGLQAGTGSGNRSSKTRTQGTKTALQLWRSVKEWVGKGWLNIGKVVRQEGAAGCASEVTGTGEKVKSGGQEENGNEWIWGSGNVAGGRDRDTECERTAHSVKTRVLATRCKILANTDL